MVFKEPSEHPASTCRAGTATGEGEKQAVHHHLVQHVAAHDCCIQMGAQVAPPCALPFVQEEAGGPVVRQSLQGPEEVANWRCQGQSAAQYTR